jgi:hypothetical protein
MIAKGTPHTNGAVLARYLVTGKDGERAELSELRGFVASGIMDAFRSVHVMARGTKCEAPFFHVYVRNPEGENLDRVEWEYAANCIERILGLTDQPRAIAYHIANDTGHIHMHVAWSRIDAENLTAKPLPFFKRRLKAVSRELEKRLGLAVVPNDRDSSIKYAPTRAEEEQARRLGTDIHETREIIRNCFERSDCGRGFQSALAQLGMTLARGTRRDFLVVDGVGGMHALGKRVLGVSAAELRTRLADLSRDNLPTVDEVRAANVQPAKPHSEAFGRPPATPHRTVATLEGPEGSDIDAVRNIDSDQRTADTLQGRQEKNLGSEEGERFYDLVPPMEPRLPIAATHSETAETILPPRTEAKPPGVTGNIRSLFRAVMKAITRRGPSPQPQKARRKDETATGFKAAARALFRRVARLPVFHGLHPVWDAFTWLKIWEYDNLESLNCHHDSVQNIRSDHTPHP